GILKPQRASLGLEPAYGFEQGAEWILAIDAEVDRVVRLRLGPRNELGEVVQIGGLDLVLRARPGGRLTRGPKHQGKQEKDMGLTQGRDHETADRWMTSQFCGISCTCTRWRVGAGPVPRYRVTIVRLPG